MTFVDANYYKEKDQLDKKLRGLPEHPNYYGAKILGDDEDKYSIIHLARLFLVDKSAILRPSTIKYYQGYLGEFIAFLKDSDFPVNTLYELTDRVMIMYINYVTGKHNPGGRSAALRPIKVFLNWVDKLDDERPPEWRNPAYKITKLWPPLPDVRVTTDAEIKAFLGTFTTDSYFDVRDMLFFLILITTGSRASEIISIKTKNIDLEQKRIFLTLTKGNKSRYIFFDDRSAVAIQQLFEPQGDQSEFLFLSKNRTPLTYSGLRQITRRRAAKAGLEKPPSMHAFRRRYVVKLLSDDMPTETIRLLLGHSSLRVIESYSRFSSHDLADSYQKHAKALLPKEK